MDAWIKAFSTTLLLWLVISLFDLLGCHFDKQMAWVMAIALTGLVRAFEALEKARVASDDHAR